MPGARVARAPGFLQWEPRAQGAGRPVSGTCGWDMMGLEPAPDLEAVGSP